MVAAQIASGLAAAGVYEAERRRAEALAEIDRAKTAFFSNVSHEFRTPLTLMLGPLEEEVARLSRDPAEGANVAGNPTAGNPAVAGPTTANSRAGGSTALQTADADAARRDAADRLLMAHRNGLRLLRLVNTLLDFSRIEAGRAEANFQPIDLASYTADLASNFRSACERAGLRLVVRCPPLRRAVYVDADMWERTFSIWFQMHSNIPWLVKSQLWCRRSADQDAAVLSVGDTGVGIPTAELPHIFDRFHRIEGQRGRTLEGTGIGLALVNRARPVAWRLDPGDEQHRTVGTTMSVQIPLGRAHLPRRSRFGSVGVQRPGRHCLRRVRRGGDALASRWTGRPVERRADPGRPQASVVA